MEQQQTAISICIPAYRNISFLRRLLDSIADQTYKDYEIIITDDTPDNSVAQFLETYAFPGQLRYFKNPQPLGTPENWNESIRQARGKWIKLMHNDDWFSRNDSLRLFYEAAEHDPSCQFFFAAFQNIMEQTGRRQVVRCNFFDRLFLRLSMLHLFKRVYVGNPSCTLVRRDVELYYDKRFKFVVDFEYYIRCFRQVKKYRYIDEVLLNIGFHDEQVTNYTILAPEVQIPENCLLLEKLGAGILRNPFVYDYYWRLFRNLGIRSLAQASAYYKGAIHPSLAAIIRRQSRVSAAWLKNGLFSKVFMTGSYLLNLIGIK